MFSDHALLSVIGKRRLAFSRVLLIDILSRHPKWSRTTLLRFFNLKKKWNFEIMIYKLIF